ncbi:MAG: right-handed parallel beta-helix repeat-containing protein [Rikenellaceae bacterium]
MKKLFVLAFTLASLCANAQMSSHKHPSTILAQNSVECEVGAAVDICLDDLIIHDVDDNISNPFKLKVLPGDNYKASGNKVTPSSGFKGVLSVNVQVNDGDFDSNVFPLKVQVGKNIVDESKAIFVSPCGDDANTGSKESPVKSIERAKALVKVRKATTVYLREGEYFITKSINFDASDSGTEQSPITYKAYNGEEVHITGAVKLPFEMFEKATPEQVVAIDNHYVKAYIKVLNLKDVGVSDLGEIKRSGYGVKNGAPVSAPRLFIDGAAMNLARYPNVGNYNDVDKGEVSRRVFKSKSNIVNKWKYSKDIWIDGPLSEAWEWQKNKIESVTEDGIVTMIEDYHNNIKPHYVKMFYFNILEELDVPQEYYIDREKGLLYAFFPSNVSKRTDIRLSQSTEYLINLSGVNHLKFEDIIFEGTRSTAINTSKPSSYNTFKNCTVRSCGLGGMVINGLGNRVENCHVHNIGAAGIRLNGGDFKNLKPAGNVVENCEIHDFSQEVRAYNPGLNIESVGQVIRHCNVYNGPHMSVVIRGSNHIIEYCDFHDAPREYSDMLAIYMNTGSNFMQRGSIIRRNKFHDVSGSWKQSAGVYMDNETCGIVVEENYFYDNVAQESGWSVMVHGGADNITRRNVFVDCSYPFCISLRLNGYARKDFEKILRKWQTAAQTTMNDAWRRAYPEIKYYFYDGDKKAKSAKYEYNFKFDKDNNITNYWNLRTPTSNVFKDNLVYNSPSTPFVMGKTNVKGNKYNRDFYTVGAFRHIDGEMQECLIHSNNHGVSTNPGFVNYDHHDLRIKKGSEILGKLPFLDGDYYTKIGTKDGVIGAPSVK